MTTHFWLKYFKRNAANPLILPPEERRLTSKEFAVLSASLPCFQLGEGSDGRRLIASATVFSHRTANADFLECIRLFTAEETQHSQYLAIFMREHGIPFATVKVTDVIFRFVRRLAGIELSMRVLVCAELVALSYYRALAKVTTSRLLATICERMLNDERRHIAFEMHHIHWINQQKSPLVAAASNAVHAFFILGTIVVAWLEHRNVLKAEFSHFKNFFHDVFADFRRSMLDGSDSAFVEIHGHNSPIQGGCYE